MLAALDVADHTQAPLLDAVHHYVRWARRLRRHRRHRRTQGELFDELRRIEVLDVSRRYVALVLFARHLLPVSMRRDPIGDDSALVWLYGLRAAWLWCEAGGGRSPFGFVPRALIAAVHALLGLNTLDRQG
ncbi:hypothetical protein [Acidihalobacter yilgarnensis]|nr:hypothetical protein [Acidihalobacter yilgarnensis]